MKVVHVDGSFAGWRGVARDLVARGVPPNEVSFTDEVQLALLPGFAAEPAAAYEARGRSPPARDAPAVPAEFVSLARRVSCHREPSRWTRLYRVLWRVVREDARVLQDAADEDVLALTRMAEAVRDDVHRVHALARFRRIEAPDGAERYVAFHRPQHRVLPLAAPFFVRRFAAMRWSLLTPDAAAHWDGRALTFSPGVPRDAGMHDEVEALWRAYYATTFDPARANPRRLRSHMPRRHWETLPEGRDIAELVRTAGPPGRSPT